MSRKVKQFPIMLTYEEERDLSDKYLQMLNENLAANYPTAQFTKAKQF
jgi:hypothetical protein